MLIQASSNGDQTRVETEAGEKWADSGYAVKVIPTGRSDAQMIEPSIQVFYRTVENRMGALESQQIKVLASTLAFVSSYVKWDHNGIYLIILSCSLEEIIVIVKRSI